MTNGLSSILDLSDESIYSQRLLFPADVWTSMKKEYLAKYPLDGVVLPSSLVSTWKIVCHETKVTRRIQSGLKYLYQVYPKYFDDKDMFTPLIMLETILGSLNHQPYLLEKQTTSDVTEYDYLGNIWLPLFRLLFQGSNIRIKTSESTYAYTTQRKVEQYPEAKNVVGFKIDVRFLLDRNGKEYDWCSGEMARLDDADKAMTDKAKLNRESKDDLDYMLELCSDNDLVGCTAWQFQSAGSCGNICSINLANNGLYVALEKYNLALPSTLAELPDLLETVRDLLSWRERAEASDHIMKSLTKKHELGVRRESSFALDAHGYAKRHDILPSRTSNEVAQASEPLRLYSHRHL